MNVTDADNVSASMRWIFNESLSSNELTASIVIPVLTYESDAYSRYDGLTAYVFSQVGTDRKRVWDLHDDDDLASWRDLFEEV